VKPRELSHDAQLYRAYLRTAERLRDSDARIHRVVLDYELKREYQRFLQERNRDRSDSDGRPARSREEVRDWASAHELPMVDERVQFPTSASSSSERTGGEISRTSRSPRRTIAAPMPRRRRGQASRDSGREVAEWAVG
jgi:hypothetical protein